MTVANQPKLKSVTGSAISASDLPEGWVETTLDQLLQGLESGSRPKGGVRGITEGIPSIGGEHLNENGGFRFESIKFVPYSFFERMNQGHIQTGDILIVKDGATTGKVALVRDDFPYDPAVVNEHVFICRPDEGVYPAFLFYFLFSNEGQDRILDNFRGSAQGGINQSFAPGTSVLLAPFSEQKRIVAKVEELLARVNATRERLAKIPAILKHFRQSVLAAACAGKLTADWRRKNRSDIKWESIALEKVIKNKPRNGYSPKAVKFPTKIKILTLTATTSGKFDGSYFKYIDEAIDIGSYLWLKKGDILVQRGNTIEYVGVSALFDGPDNQYIYPDLMMKIQANEKVKAKFVYYALSDEKSRNYFRMNAIGTAGNMPKINQKIVLNTPIQLPPISEQQEIICRVEYLFKIADQIKERYEKAKDHVEKLSQSILTKAFRGELVPNGVELTHREGRSYEPASTLLAKIKAQRKDLKSQRKR